MRERLKESPSEVVIKYLFEPGIKGDLDSAYYPLIEVNKAHLIMLLEKGIIHSNDGRKIAEAIKELELLDPKELYIDRYSEDLYSNMEAYIIEKIGADIGGQLHTGRSRNDLFGTITRMNSRSQLLNACSQILELRKSILQLAEENMDTIMPGYTC